MSFLWNSVIKSIESSVTKKEMVESNKLLRFFGLLTEALLL